MAFFNRFKAFASDPDHPEFAILFPKTTDNLSNLLAYNYPQMLPKLREGFSTTSNNLPTTSKTC
ncbi:hypothetical protein [Paraflavitalea speifideaquila]|uniref:hypothetical protein n=1 Tax=Paraflavitalea speifideaquila TaxID=3076558 RepID=UPI0028E83578|nr:hypothetical protein [Paraflavitalea speifideiaquila]